MAIVYCVYIMASQKNGTLYIGVTNNIRARTFSHKEGYGSGFTSKYGIRRLVYIEYFDRVNDALAREKELKKWRRQWKIDLIESVNPDWDDLYLKLNQYPQNCHPGATEGRTRDPWCII